MNIMSSIMIKTQSKSCIINKSDSNFILEFVTFGFLS